MLDKAGDGDWLSANDECSNALPIQSSFLGPNQLRIHDLTYDYIHRKNLLDQRNLLLKFTTPIHHPHIRQVQVLLMMECYHPYVYDL